jgi:hypothetical protein
MKFLIISKSRMGAAVAKPANPVKLYDDAIAWTESALADGSLDCSYGFAAGRGGCSIVNADSHAELLRLLRSSPMFHFADYEIHALIDSKDFWTIHQEAAAVPPGGNAT